MCEGKPWKLELRRYLLAYCAIPLLNREKPGRAAFWQKVAHENPDFTWEEESSNTDADNEHIAMSKLYADRRNAQYGNIELGDKVLVKRDQPCKTDTSYN